jgi:hypothetical protein
MSLTLVMEEDAEVPLPLATADDAPNPLADATIAIVVIDTAITPLLAARDPLFAASVPLLLVRSDLLSEDPPTARIKTLLHALQPILHFDVNSRPAITEDAGTDSKSLLIDLATLLRVFRLSSFG